MKNWIDSFLYFVFLILLVVCIKSAFAFEAQVAPTSIDVKVDYLDDVIYTTLQDWIDVTQSAGLLSGGQITGNNGAGTINVTAGTGFVKTSDNELGNSLFFNWSATNDIDVSGSNNTKFKIYVDYNSGSPIVAVTTGAIDHNTQFTIGSCVYEVQQNTSGSTHKHLHVLNNAGTRVQNIARRTQRALREPGFTHVSGATLGSRGLNITISNSVFYAGINRLTTSNYDSDTTDFQYYYYNGSEWLQEYSSIIDNTNYNDITSGLTALVANRYGVHWVYLEVEGGVTVLYGQGNYLLSAAQASSPPSSIPEYLDSFGILIGRVIVQKGGATFTETSSAFDTLFIPTATSDHGELAGLADDDHTQYLRTDGTRSLTGNWDSGAFNFTNTLSWFLGKVAWDTVQNKFITAVDDIYIYMSGTTATLNETKLNSTIDSIVTASNDSMKIYVDAQDIVFNDSMKSYSDNQDSTLNTSLRSYVDSQDVIFNDSMKTYVDSQDVVFNDSMKVYADAQDVIYNDSMKAYTDAQDIVFNNSIKTYTDNTFITQANEGNLNVNSSDYANSWDGETSQADLNVNHSDTTTTWDSETSQADLNVNQSNYWDALDTPADINAGDITDDSTYVKITGDTMTGDLNISNGTYLYVYSDGNDKNIYIRHDDTNAIIYSANPLRLSSGGYAFLGTGAGQGMYLDAGNLFSFRDVDDSNDIRATIDSSDGDIIMGDELHVGYYGPYGDPTVKFWNSEDGGGGSSQTLIHDKASSGYGDGSTFEFSDSVAIEGEGNLYVTNNVTADKFIGNLTGTADVATTWDGETSQGDLNVNSSNYWDGLDTPSDLNDKVLVSWVNLTNYPAACPGGSYITNLDDSVTCTTIDGSQHTTPAANVTSGNMNISTGNMSADFFLGDGSLLTGISGGWNLTGSNYMYNATDILHWNESKGNDTYVNVGEDIDVEEVDTDYLIIDNKISDSELYIYYPFNDNALDYSVNGYDGTSYNTAAYSEAQLGKGFHFTGSGSDDSVAINSNFNFSDISDEYTIMMWVNHTQNSAAGIEVLIAQDAVDSNRSIWMNMRSSAQADNPNKIEFGGYASSFCWTVSTTTYESIVNKSTHIAGTFNGSHYKIYVNGALENSTACSQIGDTGGTIRIGSSYLSGTPTYELNGTIDEFKLYGRELTLEQIKSHYYLNKEFYGASPRSDVPKGVIVMWSGSTTDIPDCWSLCDGTSGTVDLRDRFIVGAGDNYTAGDTGGEVNHTLTTAELPAHSHEIGAGANKAIGRYSGGSSDWVTGSGSYARTEIGDTENTGSGIAHENRPPYYALAYIQKTCDSGLIDVNVYGVPVDGVLEFNLTSCPAGYELYAHNNRTVKTLITSYTGDDTNSREIDLGDDYDEIHIYIELARTYAENHNMESYAIGTTYGASHVYDGDDNVDHYSMSDANGYFQGKMTGADANKIKLGTVGNSARGTNYNGWGYTVVAKKFDDELIQCRRVSGDSATSNSLWQEDDGVVSLADSSHFLIESNPYIHIIHNATSGTNGGTATSGSWLTRPLTAEKEDTNDLATLASNQITLEAGTYEVDAHGTFWRVGNAQIRLYDTTGSTNLGTGTFTYAKIGTGDTDSVLSVLTDRFTISVQSVIELQYRVATTYANQGLGDANSWGEEVYANVVLRRVG